MYLMHSASILTFPGEIAVVVGRDSERLVAQKSEQGGLISIDRAVTETVTQTRPTMVPAGPSVSLVPQGSWFYEFSKRAADIMISAIFLLFSLPLIAVLAFVVRLDSSGPALFKQERVGKDGRPFRFYKFRTMYVDARQRFPELYTYRYEDDEVHSMFFKLPYDPRSTRVGRRLRRTSLDELPNLFNVLKGDMSLVGPRPEIPEMLRYYLPEQMVKFAVKPGLTGVAQTTGRNILRFQETIAADLSYVATRGIWTDVRIFVKTPFVVLLMLGAL